MFFNHAVHDKKSRCLKNCIGRCRSGANFCVNSKVPLVNRKLFVRYLFNSCLRPYLLRKQP
jgi:hypothetical protein